MNITFMIGNGFDLQLGLKTRYIDFYNYYIAKNNNDMIAKSINENYDLWSDLEVGLGEFTSTLSNNDIESFLDSKRNLEKHLISYLRNEENSYIVDNNAAKAFRNGIISLSNYLPDNIKNRYNRMISLLGNSFSYKFISFNYTKVLDQLIEITQNDFKPFSSHVSNNTGYNDKIVTPIHVHGNLKSGLIIGVNDETQIKNKALQKDTSLTDYMIKPKLNDYSANNINSIIKNTIDESEFIFIFGLSMGRTDDYWWSYLVKWLTMSNDHTLVIFAHEPDILMASAQEVLRLNNRFRKMILGKRNDINNNTKDSLRENIIVVPNSDIFRGIKLNSSNKKLQMV